MRSLTSLLFPKPLRQKSKDQRNLSNLRRRVLDRDRYCVAALLDKRHECADRWGKAHDPSLVAVLTLGHVHTPMGRRIDAEDWCIAECYRSNVEQHWESANRQLAWAYLHGIRTMMRR